ncbi:unnamed protein product [Paramecium pentaurelia]|uniref:Uncharacterized protein n=1 Tax=Paramecium pentaurelia TaxID=43138 RepID=A0A8S1WBY3_9CILI|nr:unnamed protein product [Paramecium pentaurelia]
MEDRALRTNLIINRYQDYQTTKLGTPGDNHYLKKENWKQIEEKNKNQFRSNDKQTQNFESKTHYQQAGISLRDKEQYNNNTNLKQSYYYEQTKPQTATYQQRDDRQDQLQIKTENRKYRDQQIPHSSDKYYSKQSGLPFCNRTPMDPRSNFNSKTPQENDSQNKFKNSYSGFKTDFKWPEYQRMYPEISSNKNNQQEKTNLIQKEQKQDQRGLLDIELRLQQRREQAQKIAGQQEGRLNYYSKSLEYSQRQQQVGLENSQERMKQFQKELRNEVQERLKEQSNQQVKQDYRNFELNSQRSKFERELDNKQKKNEILELDQFKGKLNLNERKNNDYDNSKKDYGMNIRGQQFDEQTSFQTRFNDDSKYQQVSDLPKYHFGKRQELDTHLKYDDKIKYIDRSLKHNKSQTEDIIRYDLKSEGNNFKESNDRLKYKEKLNYETKQHNQFKRDDNYEKKQYYHLQKENDQSQGVQRRLDLYEKLQQFDQKNNKKYYDGHVFQVEKLQSNNNQRQETRPYEYKQSIEPTIGYSIDKYEIKKSDQDIQQIDRMEFKRSQFQPEINQIKIEFEKKYGQFNPETSLKQSEFDKRRVFEDKFRPEPIQTKIAGAREYLDQKYYQRDPYRYEQRNSYHEESSIQDRLRLDKGNNKININNKAIEDILQGTALNKYIEKEKNQSKMMDRVVSFTSSKINYQKSPVNDKEEKLGGLGNDRYAINQYTKRLPSDQNLQRYGNSSGLIVKQFKNYDTMDRRI